MRARSTLLFAISLFALGWSASVTTAASPAVLVRLMLNEDGQRQSVVGALEAENDHELKVFDLRRRQSRTISRDHVSSMRKNITAQEASDVVGLATFVAWEIRHALPPDVRRIGRVAAVDLVSIYVTLAKDDEIREGDELQVYRGELEIKDPDTGKVIGKQRRKLAKLQVTEVQEKLSKAKLVGDIEVQIDVGDTVRSNKPEKRVAVLPFVDDNGNATREGVAIAEQLVGELVSAGVPTVERTRLAAVLSELQLQNSSFFDGKSQHRFGKQTGAAAVVTGSVLPGAYSNRLQVTVRMTNVETGVVLYGSTYQVFPGQIPRVSTGVALPPPVAPMASVPSKPLPTPPPDVEDLGLTRWLNESYNNTLRHVKDKEWAEFDNNTGRVGLQFTETGRNKDYLELFCAARNQQLRVLIAGKRMETKKNGKWEWVSNGHWERSANGFPGRWRIVAKNGETACFFTLDNSFGARKSHVPSATGRWEIVGDEARITWSDGWRDILRPQQDGVHKLGFAPGTRWSDTPANTDRAIKE